MVFDALTFWRIGLLLEGEDFRDLGFVFALGLAFAGARLAGFPASCRLRTICEMVPPTRDIGPVSAASERAWGVAERYRPGLCGVVLHLTGVVDALRFVIGESAEIPGIVLPRTYRALHR